MLVIACATFIKTQVLKEYMEYMIQYEILLLEGSSCDDRWIRFEHKIY